MSNNLPDILELSEITRGIKLIKEDPSIVTSFNEQQILSFIHHWSNLLQKQRMLIDVDNVKTLVVGDIHGDLLQVQKALHFLDTKQVDRVIFNGDVIDRGAEMIECLILILSQQIANPEKVIYLRGNHEIKSINEVYGFRGYSTMLYGSRSYDHFSLAFQQLPIAAKIGNFGFVTHGGVPREQIYFHMMRLELKIKEPSFGPYNELLWNDPDRSIQGFAASARGPNSFKFGKDVFDSFMEFHELSLFIRAHQAYPLGYRWFFDDRLLSIFSSQAGPYSVIDPHYVIVDNGDTELIAAESVEI